MVEIVKPTSAAATVDRAARPRVRPAHGPLGGARARYQVSITYPCGRRSAGRWPKGPSSLTWA